jgi:hypothetical protein
MLFLSYPGLFRVKNKNNLKVYSFTFFFPLYWSLNSGPRIAKLLGRLSTT